MLSSILFFFSGAAIATLVTAKRMGMKRDGDNFILRAIAKSDEKVRGLHHASIHLYAKSKERSGFVVKKQLPLKVRFWWNKSTSVVREKINSYAEEMRDAKLLKRSEGISEFFKSVSAIEKGGGELHDEVFIEDRREEIALVETEQAIEPEPVAVEAAPAEPISYQEPHKPRRKRSQTSAETSDTPTQAAPEAHKKPRAPRKKKLTVIEAE